MTTSVRHLDPSLSYSDVRTAVAAHFTARGMGPDVLGAEEFTRLVDEGTVGVARFERCRLGLGPRPAAPRGWHRR